MKARDKNTLIVNTQARLFEVRKLVSANAARIAAAAAEAKDAEDTRRTLAAQLATAERDLAEAEAVEVE